MKSRGRKAKIRDFKFELKNYIYFFQLALFHPKKYSELTTGFQNSKSGLFFLIVNISLGLTVLIIEKIVINRNLSLAFPAISETLFLIPLGVFILTAFATVIHIGARIFGGSGSLRQSINAACYSSIPLTIFAVPYLFIASLIWLAVLMIISFKNVHRYDMSKAVINVTFPFLIIVLGMIMFGVLNPIGFYNKLTNIASLVRADY